LRGVILSHDHYDHLDRTTILQLAKTTDVFLTPLGVGDRLIAWGVDASKVRQFDWWQGTTIDGVQFTATPRSTFSGAVLFDGNKTLWASWVIVDGADKTIALVLQRRHRLLRRLQGNRPTLRPLRRRR
jgi:L-ascorbate metabolism protein UlaG (beta-lactamase superfamily)